jgi:hypothetical protein
MECTLLWVTGGRQDAVNCCSCRWSTHEGVSRWLEVRLKLWCLWLSAEIDEDEKGIRWEKEGDKINQVTNHYHLSQIK